MVRRTRERTGIIRFIGNVADDAKDFVDDMLDRGRDVDRDMRDTVRRAVDTRRDGDDESEFIDRGELRDIREALARLTQQVDRLEGVVLDTHEDKPRAQARK